MPTKDEIRNAFSVLNAAIERHEDLRLQAEAKTEQIRGWWIDETRRSGILRELADERARQHKKWGEQDLPDFDSELWGRPGSDHCMAYGIPSEAQARAKYQSRQEVGQHTWPDVVIEELAEVLEASAERGTQAARAELVQLGAVVVQWIECLDRMADKAG